MDGSDPAYAQLTDFLNPTNGSWWMVQILSTWEDLRNLENPTNGSWWDFPQWPEVGGTELQTSVLSPLLFTDCR